MNMEINPGIFKAYDIRGVYPSELNEEIGKKVGQSFAKYVGKSPIIVGYDSRISSPNLSQAIIDGLISQGAEVINIGLCTTSSFYFTVGDLKEAEGGIMVTASHASKEFNGFKMVFRGNMPLTKEQILEVKNITLNEEFSPAEKKGSVIKKDPTDNYVKMVRGSIKEKIKPLKVVMDAGNGTAGLYIEKVFYGLGLKVVPIFLEPDGDFPNHETNPKLPENREKLKTKILEEKADLGFMFDGDSDRSCVLDRSGNLVDYSLVMAIIAEYLVKNSERKKVVYEVRTSNLVRDWVERAGGSVEITECWTIPIKLKMKSDPEFIFGGETSGHFMFRDNYEADDGILSVLFFLQAISAKEETIDEIIKKFKEKYFVLEETNFHMSNMDEGDVIIKKLKDKYSSEGAKILEIDGLSVIYPNWWFNLRKSQSEPVIRLNLEASSKEIFEEKKSELIGLIENK